MQRLKRATRGVVDELWPTVVDVGLREVEGWQRDEATAYCQRCGATAGPGAVTQSGCSFCRGHAVRWDRITRLSGYVEPMEGWIKAMKFGKQWTWAKWMGEQLAQAVSLDEGEVKNTVVCPVPMPWARRWRRGFNQSKLMAEAVAGSLGLDCVELLRRNRHTPPQTSVAASQRAANIRGSVVAQPIDLAGRVVLLVDDVKTTGATLTACSGLLRQMGAARVHAAVAAVADPRRQNFSVLRGADLKTIKAKQVRQ